MAIASFVRKKLPESGLSALCKCSQISPNPENPPSAPFAKGGKEFSKIGTAIIFFLFFWGALFGSNVLSFGDEIKKPNVAGQFYPADKDELSLKVENLLNAANPPSAPFVKGGKEEDLKKGFSGEIFGLISPHAGYDFSGPTAARGYKLIKGRPYKTVVILGPSHQYYFKGISVYPAGKFQTPLGDLEVDSDFTRKIISPSTSLRTDGERSRTISFIPQAFEKEHSIEVQLPFLQKTLDDFKIVPILIGDADFQDLNVLADKLNKAIAGRPDVLLIASTDLCHSYDYQETERVDKLTLSYLGLSLEEGKAYPSGLEKMPAPLEAGEQFGSGKRLLMGSARDIYAKLEAGSIQMCGGLPVVTAMLIAKNLGHNKLKILNYTNSAEVTNRKIKGLWTVGYLSALIDRDDTVNHTHTRWVGVTVGVTGETVMLNDTQKARLLEIARKTIQEYVTSGKKLDFSEDDPQLKTISGAFVTIHKQGELKGCIGNIIGQKPLFETIRDMAIESATGDPRFEPVTKDELKDIEIEISVLSPLKKIEDTFEFQLGVHGVLVRKGWNQGVFLPQVAQETGWSKEEFLSNLCAHKAGLPADAWKDAKTEKYIFNALVFSEKKQ